MAVQPTKKSYLKVAWQRLYDWVVNHDDSWLFMGLYIGLAVVLSIWISLFWLVAVVAVHFIFEWIRQRHLQKRPLPAFIEALWELKLDIGLVLFALSLSLYMDVIFGLVGLQSATRVGAIAKAGAKGGTRFAAWEQIIRGFFLTIDDVAQVIRVALRGRGKEEQGVPEGGVQVAIAEEVKEQKEPEIIPEPPISHSVWGSWAGAWGKGDWVAILAVAVCVALIFLSPYLTDHTWGTMIATLAEELHPYPAEELIESAEFMLE